MPKTNKEQTQFREHIEGQFRGTLKYLLIDHTKLSFNYAKKMPRNCNSGMVFSIEHSTRYHRTHITVYPPAFELWKNKRYGDLDEGIVHELCHIHTTAIMDAALKRFTTRDEIEEKIEDLTETIAQYVLKAANLEIKKTNTSKTWKAQTQSKKLKKGSAKKKLKK